MPSATRICVPTIDISVLYQPATADRDKGLSAIKNACVEHGFFLITNHGVPRNLQLDVMNQAAKFFDLPQEEKLLVDEKLSYGQSHRGYQRIGGEAYQEGKKPDLKEGFQFGEEKPLSHPHVLTKKMLSGPNQWPTGLPAFQETMELYFDSVRAVALIVLRTLADILNLDEEAAKRYDQYCQDEVSSVRLLHYPPQDVVDADQLGTGAHTDFGGITLLLTDDAAGLQVLYEGTWHDLEPNTNAYIVNIGDIMQLFTAGCFKSSLHRVINTSGKDRYSVPFFFDGNLDTVIRPLIQGPQPQGPITVEEHMYERFSTSRSRGVEPLSKSPE